MNWFVISGVIQTVLTVYFSITHWIPLFPFNNIRKYGIFKAERIGNIIHNTLQIISVSSCFLQWYLGMWVGLVYWSLWLIGHTLEWWTMYFFGWPKIVKKTTIVTAEQTLKFLPPIKNHPVPDTCHFLLGILSWLTVISIYKAMLF